MYDKRESNALINSTTPNMTISIMLNKNINIFSKVKKNTFIFSTPPLSEHREGDGTLFRDIYTL